MTDLRTKLTEEVAMVCAGHPVGVTIPAVTDVLVNMVAFASADRAQADALVERLIPDMKRAIAENWDYVASVKAASRNQAGSA